MGRGSSLKFGEISILSETESLAELQKVLADVLLAHGYPGKTDDVEEKLKQVDQALEKVLHAEASMELKQALAPQEEKGSIVNDLEEPDHVESVDVSPVKRAAWRKGG